ncbi:50S ribosome-binding GTPase [Candidatus Pacearchaeota archaeon]|nr:50S ribosome-binding GTPase [Candidatus Pacearchaeota archaeon]
MRHKQKKHLEKIDKQREKFLEIAEKIVDASDIVLQVLDSRFISETRNKEFENLIKEKQKKLINIINKSDLIENKKLEEEFGKELYPYVFISCIKRTGIKKLRDLIKRESKKINKDQREFSEEVKKLVSDEKVSIGVIGYPNTGKSSLINILVGKKVAGTASEAGFTKGIQKLRLEKEINLIDTPGIIPREIYSDIKKQKIATHTKLGGRSYSQVKEPEIIISEIMKEHPGILEKFYKIDSKGDSEILIEKLGRKKGFLKKHNIVDGDKTSRFILRDWQEGRIKI